MDETTMRQLSWVGDGYVAGEIRGVALSFHGLGHMDEKRYPTTVELEWGRDGWLVVFPYYGPWNWMNRQARAFVDDLVASVYRHFGLNDSLPLACTGGSMGGLSALLYARYARRPVAACLALFPVCDLKYHFGERPDLPRSIRNSLMGYEGGLEALLAEHSPLAQAVAMPDMPYLLLHGDRDEAVNKAAHSDAMVAALRALGRRVEYVEVPGMGHGHCMPLSVSQRMVDFMKGIR